jgi:hypothetical protein
LKPRVSSSVRGLLIALLMGAYAWFLNEPQASFGWAFLLGAALQLAVIVARKWVSADTWPRLQDLFELLIDAVSVLAFAVGVYGGVLRVAYDL